MTVQRAGTAAATIAFTGLAVFGLQAPALANHVCPNPAGHYPPGQCRGVEGSVGDKTPAPGSKQPIEGKGYKPGSKVDVYAESTPIFLGSFTANAQGVISGEVTIPLGLSVGAHSIVMRGISPTGTPIVLREGITITAANAAAARGNSGRGNGIGALPTTGGEIASVTAVGIALVGVGAAAVYSGRRRRLTAA